jgi:hypothetical protein
VYIQFFDTTAAVTVGTTPNKFWVVLAPSLAANPIINANMFTGIQVAATAGPTNGTTPGTALPCTVFYK